MNLLLILRCLGPISGPSNPPSCTQVVHKSLDCTPSMRQFSMGSNTVHEAMGKISGCPTGRTWAALVMAFSLSLVSCRGYIHSLRPGVPPNEELISPTVTILPAGTPVSVRLLQSLNTHTSPNVHHISFGGEWAGSWPRSCVS